MITPEELIIKLGIGTDDAVCVQRLLDQIPAYKVRRDAHGQIIPGHVVPGHEVRDAAGHVHLVPAEWVADPVLVCVRRDAAGRIIDEHVPEHGRPTPPVPPTPPIHQPPSHLEPHPQPLPSRPLPPDDDDEKDEPKPKKRG